MEQLTATSEVPFRKKEEDLQESSPEEGSSADRRRWLAEIEAQRSIDDLASSESNKAVNKAMHDKLVDVARCAVENAYVSNEDMSIFNYNAPEGLKQDVFAKEQSHQMGTEKDRVTTEIGLREADIDKLGTINDLKRAQLEAASIEANAQSMGRSDIVAGWGNDHIDALSQNMRPELNETDTIAAWDRGNYGHKAVDTRSIITHGDNYDNNRTPLAH